MGADLVLLNGVIHAFGTARSHSSAVVIRDGRIAFVGDDATALDLAPSRADKVDLKGCCVIPGLADAHMHLSHYALSLARVDVETPTLDGALERVRERAARTSPGDWILGRGWNHNVWGGDFPTAAQLDRVAPDNPVFLGAKSGHAGWANSCALAMAGVTSQRHDPAGGEIVRDADGLPTGMLLEGAMHLVGRLVPEPKTESLIPLMREAIASANRAGLTMLHDMDGSQSFAATQMLRERGELHIRILKSIPLEHLDEAIALGMRSGLGDDWLRIGQVKMLADGALGPRTAWMLGGYETDPSDTGIPTAPIEALSEAVRKANDAGLGCAIHAIGDRACREVLDIYQACGHPPNAGGRNRIEHSQILHPQDVGRFAELGAVASMQPIHCTSDMHISDRHLGGRAAGAYAFRSLLDQGAHLALGSDCPVETIDPLVGIHAAATRRRADGSPGPDGWHPEQRLTVPEVVRGYTGGAAYAAGVEDRLGDITVGKLGDVTILDRDIFAIEPMEILETRVMGTVVGGRFVWRDDSL